jgi:hypothetical protein
MKECSSSHFDMCDGSQSVTSRDSYVPLFLVGGPTTKFRLFTYQHPQPQKLYEQTITNSTTLRQTMDNPSKSQAALFQVYLRLRPAAPTNHSYPTVAAPERFLTVEEPSEDAPPTHITLNPPNDNRRRAVEKFAFTKVFEEDASQLDLFGGTGVLPLVEGVLGPNGGEGRDGLLATLGVTGSGKVFGIVPRILADANNMTDSYNSGLKVPTRTYATRA